jgi:signal transduction histidine kinase
MLSFALIILLLVCFFHATIGLFVILKNPRDKANIWFFVFTTCLVIWLLSNYFSNDMSFPNSTALIINKSIFLFSILGIYSLCCFSIYFSKTHISRPRSQSLHAITAVVALSCLTPFVVSDIQANGDIYEISFGILAPLYFASLLFYFCLSIYVLIKKYIASLGADRQRLQYVILSLFLGLIFSLVTNALFPTLFNIYALSALGPISTILISAGFSYAIIRHHLFDIRLVVARSVAYSLLLTILAGGYSLVGVGIIGLFSLDQESRLSQDIVYALLEVVLAFIFQPLRHFFERITDSIFYQGGYDANDLLANLGAIMAREIELKRLTTDVINELTSKMKLSKATIVVLDEEKIFYVAEGTTSNHKNIDLEDLNKIDRGVVLKDFTESVDIKSFFSKYGINVSVDLRSTNELVGYLLLGDKKSGDIFNTTDIKALDILAHELAIAIHNAKSYTQIQDFNKTLQKRIDEATAQLRDANEHLKELDQLKNEFLSMATHQLNTPLTVVDGYLTLINDGVVSEPSERKDYLEKTLGRVRGMKRMVADFLNVSRIESGKFIIDVKPTDINKMISEEVNGLGPSAKEKEVLLQFIPPKHPVPLVEIDEQKTRQAAMNLIDNAIYYTPKGEIKIYLDSDQDYVTFKVIDNGIGVPEKQKDKLFQKFYRADNAKSERPNGNGVGLYLVKRVIEDQGGKIIFESAEGKGSTFGFTLPIKASITNEKTPDSKELVKTAG